mgnify:CR=1 FL=1
MSKSLRLKGLHAGRSAVLSGVPFKAVHSLGPGLKRSFISGWICGWNLGLAAAIKQRAARSKGWFFSDSPRNLPDDLRL